jgi:hypothetical protein
VLKLSAVIDSLAKNLQKRLNEAEGEVRRLQRRLAEVGMQWQPMDTAPKDGTRILAFGKFCFESEDGISTARWNGGRWVGDPNEATEYEMEACELSHWMPLPAPPTATKDERP